jgi:hypothetical protein
MAACARRYGRRTNDKEKAVNTPRKPEIAHSREEQPVNSFTRVIAVAPRANAFGGWGPSRWN